MAKLPLAAVGLGLHSEALSAVQVYGILPLLNWSTAPAGICINTKGMVNMPEDNAQDTFLYKQH